jgi:hypothetical protein
MSGLRYRARPYQDGGMTEKTEWEIVDQDERRDGYTPPPLPPTLPELLRALLGRWWAWKVAGVAVLFGALLVLLATVAGVLVVIAAGAAVLSAAVAKFRKWKRDISPPR